MVMIWSEGKSGKEAEKSDGVHGHGLAEQEHTNPLSRWRNTHGSWRRRGSYATDFKTRKLFSTNFRSSHREFGIRIRKRNDNNWRKRRIVPTVPSESSMFWWKSWRKLVQRLTEKSINGPVIKKNQWQLTEGSQNLQLPPPASFSFHEA